MARLCIALDMASKMENLNLCKALVGDTAIDPSDLYLKVGLRSFIRDGIDFIDELNGLGFGIFLDLKLYDIPNTMLDSIGEIMRLPIDMLTIHASAGRSALNSIASFINRCENPPLVFAVSALTSFWDSDFGEIYNDTIDNAILKFAKITSECGINGIVCSPLESKMIKKHYALLTLTPGVRPISEDFSEDSSNLGLYASSDDQARSASIKMALECGSDFVVIGRPIYTHANPPLLVKKILEIL